MDRSRGARILLNLARGGMPPGRQPPDVHAILHGGRKQLLSAGLRAATVERLIRLRGAGEPLGELERAASSGTRILLPEDADFPEDLRAHPHCPPVLYLRGACIPAQLRAGIVGARNASRAMERFSSMLGEACARSGVAVVSGLARGIDAAAHAGCLAGDGFPIGVLGCGADMIYPRETARLHASVLAAGSLISTFPMGAMPKPYHFPRRNRIVAALSTRVVVVQATEGSGSMSTARAALDTNTEVCAVPGSPDDPLARGTNRLIRDGAAPILEPSDLLEPMLGVGSRLPEEPPRTRRPEPDRDSLIRLQIGSTPLTADEISSIIRVPLSEVLERLTTMELDRKVERLPGRLYLRRESRG